EILLDSMQPEVIAQSFEKEYKYLIARDTQTENQIIGVLGMKNPTHIFHFFVRESYHGQGIGRLLWQHLLDLSDEREFTVNASRYAQNIYKKLGFSSNGKLFEKNGISCFPMIYSRSSG
ncbi:MAG: GNAT family N-acetyltransferase, partial [Kangiellaceae bacterium]|nr:GNAT family N-acetyltransferase [Kangiellaceae bacterium]